MACLVTINFEVGLWFYLPKNGDEYATAALISRKSTNYSQSRSPEEWEAGKDGSEGKSRGRQNGKEKKTESRKEEPQEVIRIKGRRGPKASGPEIQTCVDHGSLSATSSAKRPYEARQSQDSMHTRPPGVSYVKTSWRPKRAGSQGHHVHK